MESPGQVTSMEEDDDSSRCTNESKNLESEEKENGQPQQSAAATTVHKTEHLVTTRSASKNQKKLKIKITGWNTLAYWKWLANDDKCGICRTAFDGCCSDCKIPGDDCPLVWGVCSHCFHMHCIMKWLSSQQSTQHTQQCPMCRQDWALKSD